ncbi:gamma-glutamylcyclotransferase [Mucilaginibacter sp. L3T2-6]|uniref:gamma-glutamylcyclotransferase family protein n=1 Tax=Mucilaginibacter sp. L3T2-6 TaxID=3062491 RepID=UPI0026768ABD|nr:gamma-glutamylcyclotransferase family protein [Mucilaginibacter sp. L3T2-6]MDO3641194.1 gamma-glutamylcyclotransferase family protein [Mucilaginibacter sp. L3T2-6]MDV6213330.1 gamma-glutamylcyclotransferase family protein [Mucilaginibacter sp. L3T2-6]
MSQLCTYLFVYGTLLDRQNQFGAYLNDNCIFYADGKMRGKLYDLGEYPGAVLTDEENKFIHGKIFHLNNIKRVLKILDDYEGFGPEQEQPNLFTRVLIDADTFNKKMKCWVYLYNLPVKGFNEIESGIYILEK